MVVWIIGLSGSGKTTIANELYSKVRSEIKNVVKVDGDIIREMFQNDIGHSVEHRKRNADRISKLCKFLEDQGIVVICSILSAFQNSKDWNRQNFDSYYEIYIEASKKHY